MGQRDAHDHPEVLESNEANGFAWCMIILYAAGNTLLWVGSIINLYSVGGFKGIFSWQTLARPLVVYRGYKTYRRIKRNEVMPSARQRLWVMLGLTVASFLAGGWATILTIQNLASGRLGWSEQDTLAFGIAGVTTLVVGMGWWLDVIPGEIALFAWVASCRAVPTSLLAVSPDLAVIPWLALWGAAGIAAQSFVVNSIELKVARLQYARGENTKDDLDDANWIWRGEVASLVSILFPCAVKSVKYFG